MSEYKIFANYRKEYQAVKLGWSWTAFFFGVFWAYFKKMWVLGSGVLAVLFVVTLISNIIGGEVGHSINSVTGIGSMVLAIVFGVNGNRWRELNLLSRGFEFKALVNASNADGAIANFVKDTMGHDGKNEGFL